MTYQFNPAYRKKAVVDAQRAGEALEHIRSEAGKLTPRLIVQAATDDGSPLHRAFEWNDTKAAELWRLEEAGDLVRKIVVVLEVATATDDAVVTRAFIHVDDRTDDARYEPLATVLADATLYAQICERASAELEAFQDRYAQFTALKSIGKAAYEAVQAELNAVSEAAVV